MVLNDSRKTIAKVIGTDPDSDLAILKISLDRLPAIVLGNSDSLQVGDQVLAIGNPFGVGQTVTSGIVSGLGRNQLGINTFENFIQTDAAINPGNSGGALVDVNGNLQGINTAIYSRSGGSMGIGFAIPVVGLALSRKICRLNWQKRLALNQAPVQQSPYKVSSSQVCCKTHRLPRRG